MATAANITTEREPHSIVRIDAEIPHETLAKYRARSLAELGKEVSIDGFRKGHVPEHILVSRIGEMTLLTDMAERALADALPEIIAEKKLDTIGRPQISITRLAPGNPFGFTARYAVVPDVSLPDYKTLAKNIARESDVVSDEELADTIANIQRQKVAYERLQKKAALKREHEEKGLTLPTPEDTSDKEEGEKDEPLPELTDEYVKTLGDFDSVAAFKEKLSEHLTLEKKQDVRAKHRAALTDTIVAGSEIDLPQVLIETELAQMFAQMEEDLKRADLSLEDYLGHIKKTREDLIKEWSPAAEKRAKLQLVLNEIAKKEKIEAPKEKVEEEVAHLIAHYKDADPERVRLYVHSTLANEEVLRMLEAQSGAGAHSQIEEAGA